MTGQRRLRAVPPSPGNRAVFYRRVSKVMGRTGEEFLSPDLQLTAMTGFAASRGLIPIGEPIDDIDESGRGENWARRDGLQRVLELAAAGRIDAVVVMKLDRFGRNTAEGLRAYKELRDMGVRLYSTIEQIDDTPEGHFMLGQFFGIAQLHSDQIARGWQQVKAHRASHGLPNVSTPPLGYLLAERALIPDPRLAPAVREVFRRYAAGESMASIAARWSATSGRATSYTSLKRMLRNPVYTGKVRLHGQVLPGRHQPLVSDAVWRRVQARIERDASTPSRTLAFVNPLGGMVVCDHCDRALYLHSGGSGRAYLICSGRERYRLCGGVGSPSLAVVEDAVLTWVEREAAQITLDVGAAAALRRSRATAAKVDVRRLRRDLAEIDRAITRANADSLRRRMPEREVQAAVELLRAERAPIEEAMRAAEAVAGSPPPQVTVKAAEWLRRRWPRMTAGEKRVALRSVVRQVRVARAVERRQPMVERVEVLFR